MFQVKEFNELKDLNDFLEMNQVKVISAIPYDRKDYYSNGSEFTPCNQWVSWVLVYESNENPPKQNSTIATHEPIKT